MSVEAITWALKQPIKQSSTKFVLVVLANCASGDTWQAYPSAGYLADATGQDRKTVLTNLARLRECGLIEDTGKRMGDTKQVIVYRLRGPDLIQAVPQTGQFQNRDSSENGTVPKTAGNSTVFPGKQSRFSAKQSQKRDTEPSETKGNRKEPSSAHERSDDEAGRLSHAEVEQTLVGYQPIPAGLDREVLARFIRHRRAIRKPVSISAWLELLPRFKQLASERHDLNESLRQTMAAGLALPVTPTTQGESNHAVDHHLSPGEKVRASIARRRDARAAGGSGPLFDGAD
jgi:hypothetical protein